MADANWQTAWDGVIAQIGQDWGKDTRAAGADRVEPGAIRRILEVLEFDCPLHTDADVARAHGYEDITAPYTSTMTFALPAMWSPGEVIFDSDSRDVQPSKSAVKPTFPSVVPHFTGYFATDMEVDFIRPAVVGERLRRRGEKLLNCQPKETKVGRGAFLTFESEVVNESGDLIARNRWTIYLYNPTPGAAS